MLNQNQRPLGIPYDSISSQNALGKEFDTPFIRLDWLSRNRFNIQWHRHTGAWFRLHRGKLLAQALKLIETDGYLHPV